MKVSMFTRYDRLGASSRLRIFQYEPFLLADGIQVSQRPFFDDEYLLRLYENRGTRTSIAAAYFRRLADMRRTESVDVIWLEKEALPWVPAGLERALLSRHVPIVADYDDAVFHRYDLHRSSTVRYLLGRKIDAVMATTALITAGNTYLADRAKAAGARRVEIVPTVVDMERYPPAVAPKSAAPLVIGWIGTPSTWTEYMKPMVPMLASILKTEDARLTAVGAGRAAEAFPHFDNLPWSENTEVDRIREMDVGIMPLTDTPWARGKCGYKLIQYMACGIPVVASPVGVNADIVEHGVNGFLAHTQAEWRDALVMLMRDRGLRQRMGAEGRRKVERFFSLQVWGPRVATMLNDVAEIAVS